jgi:ribosomal protein S18 acetylase RimI-like enzyme
VLAVFIRELDPGGANDVVRGLVIALQNYERQWDPAMPEGHLVVNRYVDLLLERCRKWDGKMFIANEDGDVVGFVCVWARVPSEEPDEDPSDYAFISDLVVAADHRRHGVGSALMSAAEAYARARGGRRIRLRVLARNEVARRFYRSMNYQEREIELQKTLVD